MLLAYWGKEFNVNEGGILTKKNSEFSEDISAIIRKRFGYELNGGSYMDGKLHLGFYAGCSENWQMPVARLLKKEFGIREVYIDGILYTA